MFSLLLAFSLMLCVAQKRHWPIPNPLDWITAVYKPMSNAILSVFN